MGFFNTLYMYDFDSVIDRSKTDSYKIELRQSVFGNANVIPLWVADMDFAAPAAVVKTIQERSRHEIFGYTIRKESFQQAVVNWQKNSFGWNVDPSWIEYSPGVVPAIAFSILANTAPGDGIIINPPVYPPFFSVVKSNNRHLLQNPLIKGADGRYSFDFDGFEELASRPDTKAFILCHPHNPSGRDWTVEELTKIGDICLKHGVLVLSDEIHSDLVFGPRKHVPFAAINRDFAQNSMTYMAPSKTFNIAGFNTSYVISENTQLLKKYREMQLALQLNLGNVYGAIALEAAYNHCGGWLKEMLAYVRDNMIFVDDYLKKNIPAVKMWMPEATYLLWLDFNQLGLSQDALRDLVYNKAAVGLNDGLSFGVEGQGFMRMNVASPQSVVKEALDRLKNVINQ